MLWLGVVLAITGNVIISAGLNLQKWVHNRIERAGNIKHYTKDPLWWLGFCGMSGGELGNFIAFGFAPTSLVSPLGAVSVVTNSLFSLYFLKEPFRLRDLLGCACTIGGGILLVLFSPGEDIHLTCELLLFDYMASPGFIVYVVLLVVATVAIYWASRHWGTRHCLFYILLCSSLGAITVMCFKGVSSLLATTLQGNNQMSHWLPYVLVVIAGGTAVLQINFLNRAMMAFGNSEVVPVYYVLFTLSTILSGIVLYREFYLMDPINVIMFCAGCAVIFVGIYMITSKRAARPKPTPPADEASSKQARGESVSKPERTRDTDTLLEEDERSPTPPASSFTLEPIPDAGITPVAVAFDSPQPGVDAAQLARSQAAAAAAAAAAVHEDEEMDEITVSGTPPRHLGAPMDPFSVSHLPLIAVAGGLKQAMGPLLPSLPLLPARPAQVRVSNLRPLEALAPPTLAAAPSASASSAAPPASGSPGPSPTSPSTSAVAR